MLVSMINVTDSSSKLHSLDVNHDIDTEMAFKSKLTIEEISENDFVRQATFLKRGFLFHFIDCCRFLTYERRFCNNMVI